MINIPAEELLETLKEGYLEYKKSVTSGSDDIDLAHIKGFCTTLEQILTIYGGISPAQIKEIKKPILGDISLKRPNKKNGDINYDIPTIFRKQFD